MACIEQSTLDKIFPPEKTDAFFDAIYGGAEEGAYDIHLACGKIDSDKARLRFELRRRAGQCLKCSLTYGLPQVFQRHPLLNVDGAAREIADCLGWKGKISWKLGQVEEISDDLHVIPFEISKD